MKLLGITPRREPKRGRVHCILASNHLSSCKVFDGVDRYRNYHAQRQSLLFGCAVVLDRSLWAAHFSGSEGRRPRKHLPNIVGVSNSALGLAARVGEPTWRRTCSSPRESVRLAQDHGRQRPPRWRLIGSARALPGLGLGGPRRS